MTGEVIILGTEFCPTTKPQGDSTLRRSSFNAQLVNYFYFELIWVY